MHRFSPLLLCVMLLGCRDTDPILTDADGDGFYLEHDDCNDTEATVNPGATETCDGIDQNCNSLIDDAATDATTFFLDYDGDGYGAVTATELGCDVPNGYVSDSSDCDDTSSEVHPGANEADCTDPTDYNCDGTVGFDDADGDGFAACLDCDDSSAAVNPDAAEQCDGTDNDCDGATDEAGATGEQTWYSDGDGDGYGWYSGATTSCDQPADTVTNADDCNDSSADAHPGGVETCDDLDNDCDGNVDGDATDEGTWYGDGDGDGFGNADVAYEGCDAPLGFVADASDCDDGDDTSFPGGSESCDGADNNCDGTVDDGFDADNDGFSSCVDDCDDSDSGVNPGVSETCDAVDNDCNGLTDESGATSSDLWYLDYDQDGYGDDALEVQSCASPSPLYVSTGGDCNDLDDTYSPGVAEGCDGGDYNCDGDVDSDGDGDGYADMTCGGLDCDDSDAAVKPSAGGGCAMGTSCMDILTAGRATTSGVYGIDPDGIAGPMVPRDVYCDLDTDGGGWGAAIRRQCAGFGVRNGRCATRPLRCGLYGAAVGLRWLDGVRLHGLHACDRARQVAVDWSNHRR